MRWTFDIRATMAIMLLLGGLALVPGAGMSQEAEPSSPWARAPSASELFASYPLEAMRSRQDGVAALHCLVSRSQPSLADCSLVEETPAGAGFGAAALALSEKYRLADDLLLQSEEPVPLEFEVTFDLYTILQAASAEPPDITEAKAQDRLVWRDPVWLETAGRSERNIEFPARALRAGVSGEAVVRCRINSEGKMNECAIIRERPSGYDFGTAAMRIMGNFIAAPRTRIADPVNGRPIEISTKGLLVEFPVKFDAQ